MKRFTTTLAALLLSLWVNAQLPAEWAKFTTNSGYLYEFVANRNDNKLPEGEFRDALRADAIVKLSEQIEMTIQSIATMEKRAIDGHTHIQYSTTSTFMSNVELSLVATDVVYKRSTKEGMAIAYINKADAIRLYRSKIEMLFGQIESHVELAGSYIPEGYVRRATDEYRGAENLATQISDHLTMLSIFGASEIEVGSYTQRLNSLRNTIERGLHDSRHSLTIFMNCEAELFSEPFTSLSGRVKGGIAEEGCNFVTEQEGADWMIEISATAREHNSATTTQPAIYTAYVDAAITITNLITNKEVCNNHLTAKGTHTANHEEAARAAYKEIEELLINTRNRYIEN